MAKDKIKYTEDFFSSEPVQEVKVPVVKKSGIKAFVHDFVKSSVRALDASGNMYTVPVTKDNVNLKAGDTIWIN